VGAAEYFDLTAFTLLLLRQAGE
jgi:hypothetical protein